MSGDASSPHEENAELSRPLLSEANEADDSRAEQQRKFDRAIYQLYTSHAFSRWGNRMWEFGVAIFFMEIWPSSLTLVALYGLMEAAAVTLLGQAVGRWVDKSSRIKAVCGALITQNLAILVAAGSVSRLIIKTLSTSGTNAIVLGITVSDPITPKLNAFFGFDTSQLEFWILVVVSNVLGGFAALAALGESVSVEKDWVVVLAQEAENAGLPAGQLARLNTSMRRIDLICKLVGPIAVGALISAASALPAIIFIATWNVLSIFVEFTMLHLVYKAVPALSKKALPLRSISSDEDESLHAEQCSSGATKLPLLEGENEVPSDSNGGQSRTASDGSEDNWWKSAVSGWTVYVRQTTFLPALSISFLYLTVLSFGTLMTADLTWRGVSALTLSVARGASAVTGLMGTVIYPYAERKIFALRTGLWSIWLQWAFLSLCVLSIFTSLGLGSSLLMAGVIGSRLGLWMFDLAVTQLMQESVAENERGIVGGVHGSLQQFFQLLSYAAGLLVSDPVDFWILIILSFFMVTSAALLYVRHCYIVRGHIFHFDFLFK